MAITERLVFHHNILFIMLCLPWTIRIRSGQHCSAEYE